MMSYVLFTLCVAFGLFYVRLESPLYLRDFYKVVLAELQRFCNMKQEWPTARYKELLEESKQFKRDHKLISIFTNFVPDEYLPIPEGIKYDLEIELHQWPLKAVGIYSAHKDFARGRDKRVVFWLSVFAPTAYLWILHFLSILLGDPIPRSEHWLAAEAGFLFAFTMNPGLYVRRGRGLAPKSKKMLAEAIGRINEEMLKDQNLTKTKI